jgi:hypothetical protein
MLALNRSLLNREYILMNVLKALVTAVSRYVASERTSQKTLHPPILSMLCYLLMDPAMLVFKRLLSSKGCCPVACFGLAAQQQVYLSECYAQIDGMGEVN